jgi:hypothetical protein
MLKKEDSVGIGVKDTALSSPMVGVQEASNVGE